MTDQQVQCIVKLGGRAVTVKEQNETANAPAIEVAAKIFHNIEDVTGKYIVVHGAGSFGHFQAKEYGVANGYRNAGQECGDLKQVQMGLCKTRLSVTKLNHMIVSQFVQHGIPAVGMSPFNGWITEDKEKVVLADIEVLRRSLNEGYLPVMHGDAVIDNAVGCCILGGDLLIEKLCSHFNPKRVVFLTDVDGIYDRPPDQQGANHIPQITVDQDGDLSNIATTLATSVSDHDVTGGILGKISCAARIASQSQERTKVYIGRLESEVSKMLVRDGIVRDGLMTEICFKDTPL